MRVACLQMNSGPSVPENLAYIDTQLKAASQQGVDLIQLPENFAQMPKSANDQVVEVDGTGEIQHFLANAAAQYQITIVAGAMPIVDPASGSNTASAKPFARCLIYDHSGERLGHYDKIHLFNVQLPNGSHYRESDRFSPARQPSEALVVTEINARQHAKSVQLGLSICYDLRFPEHYRRLMELGAQLVSVPSAFTYETGQLHWQTLLMARAVENLNFVFAAAQTGHHASGRRTWGHSMIVDPWGKILACAEDQPGLIFADISLTELAELRARFPALTHRRL